MAKQGPGETNSNGDASRMNGHASGHVSPKASAGTTDVTASPPRSLGEQIREVIGRSGLAAREVAYLCGVSEKSGRQAMGQAGPPVSDVVALRVCVGLGLTLRVGPPDPATLAKLQHAHQAYLEFEAARDFAARDPRGGRPR